MQGASLFHNCCSRHKDLVVFYAFRRGYETDFGAHKIFLEYLSAVWREQDKASRSLGCNTGRRHWILFFIRIHCRDYAVKTGAHCNPPAAIQNPPLDLPRQITQLQARQAHAKASTCAHAAALRRTFAQSKFAWHLANTCRFIEICSKMQCQKNIM